ncbi:MAG: 3-hydroxyacyl-CoA dehydrogenase family protein [Magnetospiraceae bacterium]
MEHSIQSVAMLGAGTMGTGIAISAIAHGFPVCLIDLSPEALERARGKAQKYFDRQVEKGRLSAAAAAAAMDHLTVATDLSAVSSADLIVEAVFENRDLKLDIFSKIQAHLKPGAIVATNTSALRVADLAAAFPDPTRFAGMHYFSPAEINPVVEVVRGENTADSVVLEIDAFCRGTGKTPLNCRDQSGFAINRFFCPYTNEAARLFDEGIGTPAQIDRVAQETLDVAVGPFFVMNLVKPRINLHAIQHLEHLGAFYAPAESMTRVGDADGSWDLGEDKVDPATDALIADRLRAGLFLPILEELDEAVATPEDIDMGAGLALRIGKAPCALMDSLGAAAVEKLIAPLCERYGAPLPQSLSRVGGLVAIKAA